MKTTFLNSVLFLLFIVTGISSAQAQNTKAFLKYTLNGVENSFIGDEVSYYYTKGEKLSEDEKEFEVTAGYVDILNEAEYKLSFYIRTASNTKPKLAKIPIMSGINQTEYLPSVNVKVDRVVGEDYTFYDTVDMNKGSFEITKAEGDWIEGTFSVTVPNTYDEDGAPVEVTNGSFRIKLERLL